MHDGKGYMPDLTHNTRILVPSTVTV